MGQVKTNSGAGSGSFTNGKIVSFPIYDAATPERNDLLAFSKYKTASKALSKVTLVDSLYFNDDTTIVADIESKTELSCFKFNEGAGWSKGSNTQVMSYSENNYKILPWTKSSIYEFFFALVRYPFPTGSLNTWNYGARLYKIKTYNGTSFTIESQTEDHLCDTGIAQDEQGIDACMIGDYIVVAGQKYNSSNSQAKVVLGMIHSDSMEVQDSNIELPAISGMTQGTTCQVTLHTLTSNRALLVVCSNYSGVNKVSFRVLCLTSAGHLNYGSEYSYTYTETGAYPVQSTVIADSYGATVFVSINHNTGHKLYAHKLSIPNTATGTTLSFSDTRVAFSNSSRRAYGKLGKAIVAYESGNKKTVYFKALHNRIDAGFYVVQLDSGIVLSADLYSVSGEFLHSTFIGTCAVKNIASLNYTAGRAMRDPGREMLLQTTKNVYTTSGSYTRESNVYTDFYDVVTGEADGTYLAGISTGERDENGFIQAYIYGSEED